MQESEDHLDEFMAEYLRNAREISKIVTEMLGQVPKNIDEDEFDVQVCWQVTDNMHYLLAVDPTFNMVVRDSPDVELCLSTIREALSMNKLITLKYEGAISDARGFRKPEHWTSCVGSNGQVHLIQFQPDEDATDVDTMSIDQFIQKLKRVMRGEEPDWFHGNQTRYCLWIEVYERKKLGGELIKDFLRHNQHLLSKMNARIRANRAS